MLRWGGQSHDQMQAMVQVVYCHTCPVRASAAVNNTLPYRGAPTTLGLRDIN